MWSASHPVSFTAFMIAICYAYYYLVVAKYALRGIAYFTKLQIPIIAYHK